MLRVTMAGAFAALALAGSAAAQTYVARNFDKGPVTLVQEWRIAPGKMNAFMADFATNQRKGLEIGKAKDGILNYGAATLIGRREGEPNLITTITFKNLAAYDRSFDRADATAVEVYGSLEKAAAAGAERGQMATQIASRLYQGLVIK